MYHFLFPSMLSSRTRFRYHQGCYAGWVKPANPYDFKMSGYAQANPIYKISNICKQLKFPPMSSSKFSGARHGWVILMTQEPIVGLRFASLANPTYIISNIYKHLNTSPMSLRKFSGACHGWVILMTQEPIVGLRLLTQPFSSGKQRRDTRTDRRVAYGSSR
jgi:hypothetical protein